MCSRSVRSLAAAGSIEDTLPPPRTVLNVHSTEEGVCRAAQAREAAFNDVFERRWFERRLSHSG
jgi:hypothetical protein